MPSKKNNHIKSIAFWQSLRVRMLTLLLSLALLCLVYSIFSLIGQYSQLKEGKRLQAAATLALSLGSIIHELQKERGLSAGYLVSRGRAFSEDLPMQRRDTDSKRAQLANTLASVEEALIPSPLLKALDSGERSLNALRAKRDDISNLTIGAPASFVYFTELIDSYLAGIVESGAMLSDAAIARDYTAYVMFLRAKELAGRERATVNEIFASQASADLDLLERFFSIITAQDTFLQSFRVFSDEQGRAALESVLKSASGLEAKRLRKIARDASGSGNYGIEPSVWFNTITAKIDLMKSVEDRLAQALSNKANTLLNDGLKGVIMATTLSLIVLGLVLVFFLQLRGMLKAISSTVDVAQRVAAGDLRNQPVVRRLDEIGLLETAMASVFANISAMVEDAEKLQVAAAEGRLDVRADTDSHQGAYKEIIQGFNQTLASVVSPLKAAAAHIKRISVGDIPPPIADEYKGDFNEIKLSLNQAISVLNLLDGEIGRLTMAARGGQLSVRADLGQLEGSWRAMITGLNNLVDAFVAPIAVTANYIDRIAAGDIPPKITDAYEGDFDQIKRNLNNAIDVMGKLNTEISSLITAAQDGALTVRADVSGFSGDWGNMVFGLNALVDAFVQPINVTADYVERIARGNIPPKITQEYHGDFNAIKRNLNQAVDVMNSLTEEIGLLTDGARSGQLEQRAKAAKFEGGWNTMVAGLNDLVEAFAAPLEEAGQVVAVMATGDLRPRMSDRYEGEFSKFKDNINALGSSLEALIDQVNRAVLQTASTAQEIAATAESLSVSSREQTNQSDQIATAVEDMARTITENAMNASRTAEVAEQSEHAGNSGGQVLEQTIQKMHDISSVVHSSAQSIAELGEASREISEITSVIDDIAYQTNLLALNAAIEAARAGEQGKGFAVVADEVRKLAERTGEATKKITVMIAHFRQVTQKSTTAMETGTNEVKQGIEFADKAGASLQEILMSIRSVLDRVHQIAQASEQQSATSEQISASVTSISDVARESAQQVDSVAQAVESMASMTEELSALMGRFRISSTATT